MRVKLNIGGIKSEASEIDLEGQGFEMLNIKIVNELKEILKDADLAKDLYWSRAETRLKEGQYPVLALLYKLEKKAVESPSMEEKAVETKSSARRCSICSSSKDKKIVKSVTFSSFAFAVVSSTAYICSIIG